MHGSRLRVSLHKVSLQSSKTVHHVHNKQYMLCTKKQSMLWFAAANAQVLTTARCNFPSPPQLSMSVTHSDERHIKKVKLILHIMARMRLSVNLPDLYVLVRYKHMKVEHSWSYQVLYGSDEEHCSHLRSHTMKSCLTIALDTLIVCHLMNA